MLESVWQRFGLDEVHGHGVRDVRAVDSAGFVAQLVEEDERVWRVVLEHVGHLILVPTRHVTAHVQ